MTIQQHASFDSSAAELNATSKLVKAWESKNAKNAAKAGGISLMALSLAACGGSSDTTTASTGATGTDATGTDATGTDATGTDATETDAEVVTVTATSKALEIGKAGETVPMTSVADAITAINTASASTTGLDVTDVIADVTVGDGDTFTLVMGANFAGFTDSVGSMSGIESISLSNDSAVARTFDASNVSGVTTYNVDATTGSIAINDAQIVANLNLENQASGTMTLTMDTTGDNVLDPETGTSAGTDGGRVADNVTGTEDSLAFKVTAVGTANTAAATLASNASAVSLATSGYETIAVTSAGTAANLINLSTAVGATTISASGTALTITDVAAATTVVNGSGMTGALNLTTSSAGTGALTKIQGGAGDDTFNVMATDLDAFATIDGGNGTDTLSLVGAGLTMAPTLTAMEAIDVTQVTGTSTISMSNSATAAAGIEIVLDNPRNATETFAATSNLTLANDTGATKFGITGAHDGDLTTTTTGAVTVAVAAAGGATAAQTVGTNINANSASAVTVTLAEFGALTGTLTSSSADSFTATATDQAYAATVAMTGAETVNLTSNGAAMNLAGNFSAATDVTLAGTGATGSVTMDDIGLATNTTSATSLTVSGLQAGATTTAIDSGAGSLAINTTAGLGTTTTTTLNAGGDITITNTGSLGNLVTGTIGSSDGGLTINSTNAIGNLTIDDITVDNTATINLNGMLGTFSDVGAATLVVLDAGSLVVNAATYQGTAFNITATVETGATLNLAAGGGTHAISHAADEDILAVSVAGGSGADLVSVNHSTLTDTLTVTGNMGSVAGDTLTIGGNTINSTVTTSGVTNADSVSFAIGTTGATYVGGSSVDAITVAGITATASSVNTGAGADTIDLTGGIATAIFTIDAGAGADTITLNAPLIADVIVVETGDSGLSDATADNIVGFSNLDTFDIGFAGTGAFAVIDATASADVASDLAAANALLDGTVRIVVQQDQGANATVTANVYIDFDADGSADVALDLSGIEAAYDIVAADFIA